MSAAAAISYPRAGHLRLRDVALFSEPDTDECRKFVTTLFRVREVEAIEISTSSSEAMVRFDSRCTPQDFARKIGTALSAPPDAAPHGDARLHLEPDWKGLVQVFRHGDVVSTWNVVSDIPGRMRVRNPRLFRKKKLCIDVERELMTVIGVDRFKVSPLSCSVLLFYDERSIGKPQILEMLEEIVRSAEAHPHVDEGKYELMLCTGSVALAAAAQFLAPALLVPSAALLVYCSIPTFIRAWQVLTVERRLGVDVLDAIVVVMCLLSFEVFAGAVLAWCLAFGRKLLEKAQEDSRRRLVNVFGKQPRTAYLWRDGVEVLISLDRIGAGDVIVVNTGEAIPVDGIVREGAALVDQHALTGESVPVEKEPGSRVYASTLVIGGRILVTVEKAGRETTSAKISMILSETASYRLSSQSKGETLADKAVIPTMALASLGFGTVGLAGATAIINCDFGTGIRMAAPLALLSSLSLCASRGILVKDGRALEEVGMVDTMLFDKTGTLTRERPIVDRIHAFGSLTEEEVLTFSAAAERRLSHPIAAAIVEKFTSLGRPFPQTEESSYKIGYGTSVTVDGRAVHLGSRRYMRMEGIDVPDSVDRIADAAHEEGHTMIFLGVDRELAGAIELQPALRDGVVELIADLRARGVKQIAIISGDHETPTRKLAARLGVDRHFAEVLPEDKARYVELLQKEGRRVCFVGDGINDSIALRRANVSVSMRGATTVATDTAQVVFMDESLSRLSDFLDISRNLDRNVAVSWQLILAPNLACIAGAFFLGFGVMASVLANNVAAIAALANGLRPLRMLPAENEPKRRKPE